MSKFSFGAGTKDSAESAGGVLPGVYEMRIQGIEFSPENGDYAPQWALSLTVEKPLSQSASPAGGCRDWITWSEKGQVRGWILFKACGINPETLGEFDLEADTVKVIGKKVRVTVEPHSYEDKQGKTKETTRVAFRGYEPLSEAGAATPTVEDAREGRGASAQEKPDYGEVPF